MQVEIHATVKTAPERNGGPARRKRPKAKPLPKEVKEDEAATFAEAAALVVASEGVRRLKPRAAYMAELADVVAQLMPERTASYKQPLAQYTSMFKKWCKQPERDMNSTGMQHIKSLIGSLVFVINPTFHQADHTLGLPARTTFSKDLALVVAPAQTGKAANVVWIVPADTAWGPPLHGDAQIFLADMSWNGGATKLQEQWLNTAEKVDNIMQLHAGIFYAKDGTFYDDTTAAFDADAYAAELAKEQAAQHEQRMREKEEDEEHWHGEYLRRKAMDTDHSAISKDNLVDGNLRAKRHCAEKAAVPSDDLQEEIDL